MSKGGGVGIFFLPMDAVFYRMKFVREASKILESAISPEGRFHYNGQKALYLSATVQGTHVASRRYIKGDEPPRAVFPLSVVSEKIVDLTDERACRKLGIDTTHRAADWHSFRRDGLRSPTWDISDRVRGLGCHGMLYASRTDPENTMHLTLFKWNCEDGASVGQAGEGMIWVDPVDFKGEN